MIQKTRAIVLSSVKYSDSSSIVRIYTEHFGATTIMIRYGKNKKSRLKANIFQPLFLFKLDIDYKQNRDVQYCKEVALDVMLNEIPFDTTKSSIAIFLAEILSRVLKEEEANPKLFEFLSNSIQFLDKNDEGTENFHLHFLYKLSIFLGLYPDDNHSDDLPYFDIAKGCYSNYDSKNKSLVNKSMSEYLHAIANSNLNSLEKIPINGKQRSALLNILISYYKFHLPEIGQIKSLEIFKEIFS